MTRAKLKITTDMDEETKLTQRHCSPDVACGAVTYMDGLCYGDFFEEAEKRAKRGDVQTYCAAGCASPACSLFEDFQIEPAEAMLISLVNSGKALDELQTSDLRDAWRAAFAANEKRRQIVSPFMIANDLVIGGKFLRRIHEQRKREANDKLTHEAGDQKL